MSLDNVHIQINEDSVLSIAQINNHLVERNRITSEVKE